jgi:hydroxypyruvate isomerase
MGSTRRQFLAAATTTPILLAASLSANGQDDQASEPPPPAYRLAINLEIMFPREMPYEERIVQVAKCGARHYGFWSWQGKNLEKMLEAQAKHDLKCVSITGNPKTGWGTGLTKTGAEQAFLEDFEECCQVANRFGCDNLITFVGAVQKDIPKERQQEQIIAGLKRAGEIARKYNVYLTLEPLNRVESPQMTMLTSAEAFLYCEQTNHPHVKVDYDIYHRQLGEGNILNNLRVGLERGYIRFIEVGDVPGRREPGSGETNYRNIFRFLRRVGYAGYIGMEHGSTSTPQHAWDATRRLAGL